MRKLIVGFAFTLMFWGQNVFSEELLSAVFQENVMCVKPLVAMGNGCYNIRLEALPTSGENVMGTSVLLQGNDIPAREVEPEGSWGVVVGVGLFLLALLFKGSSSSSGSGTPTSVPFQPSGSPPP